MPLKIYTHSDCLQHRLYPFFAEKPERLLSVQAVFNEMALPIVTPAPVDPDTLRRIHDEDYIGAIKDLSLKPGPLRIISGFTNPYVQWYTHVSRGSYRAALQAAGAAVHAVSDVMNDSCRRAFCAVRPPGHHAGPRHGEGFCLFNNVAAGAVQALSEGAHKVAIIDFDRHHGNGTQDIVEQRLNSSGQILFVSSYQQGCKYDHNHDRAVNQGWISDSVLTIPVPEGSAYDYLDKAYRHQVIPALHDFKPDIILLSAGFDMHKSDPLSSIRLEAQDYHSLTSLIAGAADDVCGGRIVSVMEGGYDLKALAECTRFHLQALAPQGGYGKFRRNFRPSI
ncbi:MAG: histone deacetylase family protein [Micavibrio aeruginosavorus]|uniref:histone deacetylase n=1 Tax=Micavibrio aeruginosavorus TaxID=349221 RepID=A0A7T5R1X0_9BACT|nr:MAG: histone deacetylase family protein [Micavibrio aeruginosavorus]